MAVPSASTRHMINRFSYGYTPSLHKAIRKAGGPQEWFTAQLKPGKVSDTGGTFGSEASRPWPVCAMAFSDPDRTMGVDAAAFEQFEAILERPARSIDGLRDLLNRPTIFVD